MTRSFCDSCDRIRLTADGRFRNCLFAVDEFDLQSLLRSGASDDEVGELLEGAVRAKWAGHGIGQVEFIRPARSMSQIGGEVRWATRASPIWTPRGGPGWSTWAVRRSPNAVPWPGRG